VIQPESKLAASAEPRSTLVSLGEDLFQGESWLQDCEQVHSTEMPAEASRLLVHNRHMTATLNAHYAQAVALHVLDFREGRDEYRRKILLTVDAGQRVVEFGLVRLNLNVLSPDARTEIEARSLPLGTIFAKHNVLTRVEPRWYLRFSSQSPIVQYFAPQPPPEAYGRLGVIHCDGQPAVELLEVVPG
jgi:hypothetical protein